VAVSWLINGVTSIAAGQSYMADPTGFFSVDNIPDLRADNLGTKAGIVTSLNPRIAGRGGSRSCQVYVGRPSGGVDPGFAYSSSFTVPQASSATAQGAKAVSRRVVAGRAYHFGVTQPGGTLFVGRGNAPGPIRRRDGEDAVWSESMVITAVVAEAPPAPTTGGTGLGLDQITQNSMRFRFQSNGDGGSPITGWVVQYSKTSNFSSGVTTISSSGTSIISGLEPDTTYYFRAAGRNAVTDGSGTGHYGPWGTTQSAKTLSGTPGAPTSVVATAMSATVTKVDWAAPASNGGSAITEYEVEYADNSDFTGSTVESAGMSLTWTSPSLSAGTWYFRVRAKNANGEGVWSSAVSNSIVVTGYPKVYVGGSALKKPMKAYLGGTFVTKPLKRYSGGTWITVN